MSLCTAQRITLGAKDPGALHAIITIIIIIIIMFFFKKKWPPALSMVIKFSVLDEEF